MGPHFHRLTSAEHRVQARIGIGKRREQLTLAIFLRRARVRPAAQSGEKAGGEQYKFSSECSSETLLEGGHCKLSSAWQMVLYSSMERWIADVVSGPSLRPRRSSVLTMPCTVFLCGL